MVGSFYFEDREIGGNSPPLVIAEIGINHGGSLEEAFKLVDAACSAGVEVVKHQTHVTEDEMSSEARQVIPGNSSKSIFDIMEECALSEEEEFKLMRYVNTKGMKFFSSAFSRAAVERLIRFDVPVFKVGSGECNNYPLLELIANTNKPVIMSTGMQSMEAISKAVDIFEKKSVPIAILHTTNLYPTPEHLVRLGAIDEMLERFPNVPIGLSDHTLSNLACLGAIAKGASIVERHFTDISCSMDIAQCRELLEFSERMYSMRAGKKTVIEEEQVTRDFAFASIVSIIDIPEGATLTHENIWVKRPGKNGIPAEEFNETIGRVTKNFIPKNTQIKYRDFN